MFPPPASQNLFSSSSSSSSPHILNTIRSYADVDQDRNIKLSGWNVRLNGYQDFGTQTYCYSQLLGSNHLVLQQQQQRERGVNHQMGDEDHESRLTQPQTSSSTINHAYNNVEAGGGSSSKDFKDEELDQLEDVVDDDDVKEEEEAGWLQLSIGGRHAKTTNSITQLPKHQPPAAAAASSRDINDNFNKLIALDLLPPAVDNYYSPPQQRQQQQQQLQMMMMMKMRSLAPPPPPPPPPPVFHDHQMTETTPKPNLLQLQQYYPQFPPVFHHHQDTTTNSNYNNYWPPPTSRNMITPSLPSPGYYFAGGTTQPPTLQLRSSSAINIGDPASLDFRVVDPPRRPHSGVWFVLQASLIQAKEPFLPQIPKSYLRIRDGRMTVRLVMKYLVNKLRLDSESEIEITCRGQQLLPFLTLQHVRDNVWSNNNIINTSTKRLEEGGGTTSSIMSNLINPVSSSSTTTTTTDHLMLLHYGWSTS